MRALKAVKTAPVQDAIKPRWLTPPLVKGKRGPCGCGCALTPETSYGFGVDNFAREVLLKPLDPWQRLAVIHAGELLPDGRPRGRKVVIVVGRQSGKTWLLVVLCLYWMFVEMQKTILGTSTQTKYAMEPWRKAYQLALEVDDLEQEMPSGRTRGMVKAAGREEWTTVDGSRYLVTPSNEEGGRSLTLNRVVADELAWQFTYGPFGAAYYAMRAVHDAQWFGLTTPLDARSVVFNDFRKAAIQYIDNGVGDERLVLIEFSAPEDGDPLDPDALMMANPNAVAEHDPASPHRPTIADLLSDARTAVDAGGLALVEFKANSMCIASMHAVSAAIDNVAWLRNLVPGDLAAVKDRVAMCFDVSSNMQHATLYSAAELPDGTVRVDFVEEWTGTGCADRAARALPAIFNKMKVKPRAFGYLPSGPAASVMAAMTTDKRGVWPPRGVTVSEIRGELTAVCMGFEQLVVADKVVHSGDPLLNDHVAGAEKLKRGDAWVFSRKNAEQECDALYAAAGAVHLARTMPPAPLPFRIVKPSEND